MLSFTSFWVDDDDETILNVNEISCWVYFVQCTTLMCMLMACTSMESFIFEFCLHSSLVGIINIYKRNNRASWMLPLFFIQFFLLGFIKLL